jgi:hypothetical protein
MDNLAEGGQFGTKDGHIGRDFGLGTKFALVRVKTQLRILRQQRKLRNNVKRCLTKFGGQNYETCNLS